MRCSLPSSSRWNVNRSRGDTCLELPAWHLSQHSDKANRRSVVARHEESFVLGNLDPATVIKTVRWGVAGGRITAGRYRRRQAVRDGSKEDHAWS
jgi:hypothetical protein